MYFENFGFAILAKNGKASSIPIKTHFKVYFHVLSKILFFLSEGKKQKGYYC